MPVEMDQKPPKRENPCKIMKQGIAYGFSLEWNHEDYTYLKNRRKIKKSRFEDQDLQLKKNREIRIR